MIAIKAFGLNHAEMHMRRGEWAEAAKVIGIECVGLVHSCPGGEFPIGAKVAALTGGLGRTINGSYAEYTRVRVSNVTLIESDLPWAELAAIPETYATAWACLFRNLEIVRGQTLDSKCFCTTAENSWETKYEKRNSHGNKHEANTSYAALTPLLASNV